jgi:hypothetical protein
VSRSGAGRLAIAVLALLLGVAVGGCALLLHRYWWGLALGVAATVALLVAIPGRWWRRPPFALGWVAAVLVLGTERPEGDYLVALNAQGLLLLGAGIAVLVAGVAGLRPPDPRKAGITAEDAPTS